MSTLSCVIFIQIVFNVSFSESRKFIQKSQPKDNLADEELMPYVTNLLYQSHGPWATRIATLLMNIKLEANHKRTVDRCLKQCEEILKLINSNTVPVQRR